MKKTIVFFLIIYSNLSIAQDRLLHNIPCEKIVYPVVVHNIAYAPDSFYNYAGVYNYLNAANNLLKETCIEFQLCKIDSVPDYNFYNLTDEPTLTIESDDLILQYNQKHTLNLYINMTTSKFTFNGICNDSIHNIMISDTNFHDPISQYFFASEMITYLGLDGTDFDVTNRELVNNSNSDVTADSIWDTPSDPYQDVFHQGSNMYRGPQKYFYSTRRDANGEFYNPMIGNLRSSYDAYIKCATLTRGQYQYIVKNERRCRYKFWE